MVSRLSRVVRRQKSFKCLGRPFGVVVGTGSEEESGDAVTAKFLKNFERNRRTHRSDDNQRLIGECLEALQ
jgi:hypothetical protein